MRERVKSEMAQVSRLGARMGGNTLTGKGKQLKDYVYKGRKSTKF